jgi:hypothetical protein
VLGRSRVMGPDTATLPQTSLDRYQALMQWCWAQQPRDRPTFGEVNAELRWGGVARVGRGVWAGAGAGAGAFLTLACWAPKCRQGTYQAVNSLYC